MRNYLVISLLLLLCILSGCHRPDSRLTRVDALADSVPEVAVDSLRAICRDSLLTDADREYYDFLLLKTSDKTFAHHSSDTLALRIVANEERHKRRGRYPEALYLAGRVYHDLGDYPTALNYYQSALDELPDKPQSLKLKACILSQQAGILNNLRLYEQAKATVKEVIKIDSILKDMPLLMYDNELLGSIFLREEKFDSSEIYLNYAKDLAHSIFSADSVAHNMRLAFIKYKTGETDSALKIIRQVLPNIDNNSRPIALGYACRIYSSANKVDSALIFAHELIHNNNFSSKRTGYKTLLSSEFSKHVPVDSALKFINEYRDVVESYIDRNGNREALLQNAYYNYHVHQRERYKAEKEYSNLLAWVICILIVSFFMLLIILYMRIRNKSLSLKLYRTLDNIQKLKQNTESINSTVEKAPAGSHSSNAHSANTCGHTLQELQNRVEQELQELYSKRKPINTLPTEIYESAPYKEIKRLLEERRAISSQSHIWQELEDVFKTVFPEFHNNLNVIAQDELNDNDYHLAQLIKCGFKPTSISVIFGRTTATISYRRRILKGKIAWGASGDETIDDIICSL